MDGNTITIIPSESFFHAGQNVMQIRVIDGDSKLISFNIIVKCTGKMRFGDEEEEKQTTLVEQLLKRFGNYEAELKDVRKGFAGESYDNVIKALGYTPPKENTTYAVMKGATASAAGTSGLVPAPAAGDYGKYLRGDGTYGAPTNTTYSDATQTAHGLMSVSDKKKLDGIAEGANKTTVDSELSSTSTNPVQNKAVQAELTKKAPIASPSFTGTPKVPTASAGTNNTQAASTAFVTSAISTAMAGITKLDFQVVQTLPSTGVKGTFYLIANSGRGQNVYDEYLWINNKYEKLGTREIDLSSYIKQSDMVAITNSEIDAAFA